MDTHTLVVLQSENKSFLQITVLGKLAFSIIMHHTMTRIKIWFTIANQHDKKYQKQLKLLLRIVKEGLLIDESF